MKLHLRPGHIDSRNGACVELTEGLIVQGLCISHLSFLSCNARGSFNYLEVDAAHSQRDRVERVIVTEFRGLLSGARSALLTKPARIGRGVLALRLQ